MRKLQFITHFNENYSYLDSARMALNGGCKWIQLRMKNASEKDWLHIGKEIEYLCRINNATFILDDRVDLVKILHADGVHLGKNDMPINHARKYLGKDFIIGGTANTFEDIIMQFERGADYIGCGPYKFTTTKEKLAPTLGIDGYYNIIEKMHKHNIKIPVYAIGGIGYEDIDNLMQTGIDGIAISGGILQAQNPTEQTRIILDNLLKSSKKH